MEWTGMSEVSRKAGRQLRLCPRYSHASLEQHLSLPGWHLCPKSMQSFLPDARIAWQTSEATSKYLSETSDRGIEAPSFILRRLTENREKD